MIQFKLNKPGSHVRRLTFLIQPTWEVLAEKISAYFDIPVDQVGVSYLDTDGDEITLSTNEELQDYYAITYCPGDIAKFTVQDFRTLPANISSPQAQDAQRSQGPSPHLSHRNTFGQIILDDPTDWQHVPDLSHLSAGLAGLFVSDDNMSEGPHGFVETIKSESLPEITTIPPSSDVQSTKSGRSTGTATPNARESKSQTKAFDERISSFVSTGLEDDFKSVLSILENDVPIKPPVHVFNHDKNRYESLSESAPQPKSASRSPSHIFCTRESTPSDTPVQQSAKELSPLEKPAEVEAEDPPLPDLDFSSTAFTGPSLTNDLATFLNSLTSAFASHPELAEGARNIIRNAANGAYWAYHRNSISQPAEDVVRQAQAQAGQTAEELRRAAEQEAARRVTEALSAIMRAIGDVASTARRRSMYGTPMSHPSSVPPNDAAAQPESTPTGEPAAQQSTPATPQPVQRESSPAQVNAASATATPAPEVPAEPTPTTPFAIESLAASSLEYIDPIASVKQPKPRNPSRSSTLPPTPFSKSQEQPPSVPTQSLEASSHPPPAPEPQPMSMASPVSSIPPPAGPPLVPPRPTRMTPVPPSAVPGNYAPPPINTRTGPPPSNAHLYRQDPSRLPWASPLVSGGMSGLDWGARLWAGYPESNWGGVGATTTDWRNPQHQQQQPWATMATSTPAVHGDVPLSPQDSRAAVEAAKAIYKAEKERYRAERELRRQQREQLTKMHVSAAVAATPQLNTSIPMPAPPPPIVAQAPLSPPPPALPPKPPRPVSPVRTQVVSNARDGFPQLNMTGPTPTQHRRARSLQAPGVARGPSGGSNHNGPQRLRRENSQTDSKSRITRRLADMGFTEATFPNLSSKIAAQTRPGMSKDDEDNAVTTLLEDLLTVSPRPPASARAQPQPQPQPQASATTLRRRATEDNQQMPGSMF